MNPRAAAAMPMLRQPHDHHRDFRTRLRAEAPAHAASASNQDRHVMMPSPPTQLIQDLDVMANLILSSPAHNPRHC